VNQQKNQRNHQPDDRERERKSCKSLLHGLLSTINQRGEATPGEQRPLAGRGSEGEIRAKVIYSKEI
jgi:hypothetical protein